MKVHFIGLGGEGMCGVAKLAIAQGHIVSGSELVSRRSLLELIHMGAKVYRTHSPSNVYGCDIVVRSSAIFSNHVEVASAREQKIDCVKRSEFLGFLLKEKGVHVIGVAGTHGKSTTTAMLGLVLEKGGYDPTVIVGAYVPAFGSHARIGQGKYAVVEADEFDRSFLDIGANSGIITSVRVDHLDYYRGGLAEIITAFLDFANGFASSGILVACLDDESVRDEFLPRYKGRVQTYGFRNADYLVRSIKTRPPRFKVICGSVSHTYPLGVAGVHNIQNAGAAVAMARELGVTTGVIKKALGEFHGISRRYEKVLSTSRLVYIDDFGHLPHEIDAVIDTIRTEYPGWYLLCAPCLRQYHRTRARLMEFAQACTKADECVIFPLSPGLGDTPTTIRSISPKDVSDTIRQIGGSSSDYTSKKTALDEVLRRVSIVMRKSKVVVLSIGTGPRNMETIRGPLRRRLTKV